MDTSTIEAAGAVPAERAPAVPTLSAAGPGGAAGVERGATARGRGWWLLVSGAAVAILLLLGVLAYGMARKDGGFAGFGVNAVGQIGRVQPGPAPDFTLPLYGAGGTFQLSQQRGQPVVVNFWASWCPPCRDEAPVLERAWARYQARGVQFIGVDVWDTPQDARSFLGRYGVQYPNGPADANAPVDYGVTGIPETFFIRPDGTVALHWIGPLTDQQVATFIDQLLP